MTGAGDTIRPATIRDVDAIDAILRASEEPPPGEPAMAAGAQHPYLRHLVEQGGAAIAEVDGELIGFCAAVFTGRARHLADLFVRRDHQGQGHGGRLLVSVLGDHRPRTTFSSDDPRAMPLYIRAGMSPLWPNLYVTGDPAGLPHPDGLSVVESTLAEIAALETAWGRADRSAHIAYWRTLPEVRPFIVRRGGTLIAAGIGRRRFNGLGRWIDRARVAPGEEPVAPLIAMLKIAADGGDLVGACVPGPSPLLPLLLATGFRIRDRDTYMASEPGLLDPARELVNTGIP